MINYNEKSRCPICMSEVKAEAFSGKDTHKVNCNKCGRYEISGTAVARFGSSELNAKTQAVSYWIKHNQLPDNEFVYIDSRVLNIILVPFVEPKPNEQAHNLIIWLGDNLKKRSDSLTIQMEEAESIIGTSDAKGVLYIIEHLCSSGYITDMQLTNAALYLGLTISGWNYYFELKNSNKISRLAFMAMKFGDPILDSLYNDVIKTAVAETGFEIRKLDEVKRAGLIDEKLRVEIRNSKFLIADLSHSNNGAYWEAGIAEGLGLPVIYICEKAVFNDKTKSTHFDTNHHLTVLWENTPAGLEQFSQELKNTIRATLPGEARMED